MITKGFSAKIGMQRLGSQNQFLKMSNHLKTCSASFPGARSVSLLHPELLLEHVEGQSSTSKGFRANALPWQVPVYS